MKIKASVLATVLVVGTLMLLALTALLSLTDIESYLYYGDRYRKQKQAYLDAAFLLYERDSTLVGGLDETGGMQLFDDEPASQVALSRSFWGLYELVRVSSDEGRFRSARLLGYARESKQGAALYVCDNNRSFTLSGKTDIRGDVCVPRNGLLYGQVQSDFFNGKRIDSTRIRYSDKTFPVPNPLMSDALEYWKGLLDSIEVAPVGNEYTADFFDPIRVFRGGLSGVTLRGNLLVAGTEIVVDSTTRLEDVLIIAQSVRIRSGFSGTLQILAADTVVVEPRVRMRYPSGIVIDQAGADGYIDIGEGSEVSGYVVCRSASAWPESKRTPNYRQMPGSRVRGLVYVDGISQVQGTVTGSLYVNGCNYYTPQGYYMNLLYDARIYGNDLMAYPLCMENNYLRKTLKWLD